jgi:hypothetical protein
VKNGNVNTGISSGVFEKLHIICSRLVQNSLVIVLPLATQFIFDLNMSVFKPFRFICDRYLEHGNIATIGNEMRFNDLRNLSPILGPRLRKSGVIIAKLAVLSSRNPKRESSGVSLGIDVGTRTDEEVKTELLGQGHDGDKIVGAILKVEDAWGGFVVAPTVVDAESSEAGGFDFFQQVSPEFGSIVC